MFVVTRMDRCCRLHCQHYQLNATSLGIITSFQPVQSELVGDPDEDQSNQEEKYSDNQDPLPSLAHFPLRSHCHHRPNHPRLQGFDLLGKQLEAQIVSQRDTNVTDRNQIIQLSIKSNCQI